MDYKLNTKGIFMVELTKIDKGIASISIDEDFNFDTRESFTEAIREALEQGVKEIILEFDKVEYMDSSALGLLMMVKDTANEVNCKVKLKNVTGYARKTLEMFQFDKKFEIID